jgi:hypothetical protein
LSQSLKAALRKDTSTLSGASTEDVPQASLLSANDALRAFLWQGDAMVDLNEFIDASSGWTLLEARAINNAAQITGIGLFGGQRRAFLLSPTNNKAPTAVDDRVSLEQIAVTRFDVLANDRDADGDTLRVIAVTQGRTGNVVLESENVIAYTPGLAFDGSDRFSYTIDDGHGGHAEASVTVELAAGSLPAAFRLDQNYPNPFNPTTTITFGIPEKAHVTIEVFNMLGQRVSTLIDSERPAGRHVVLFEARDLPGGIYMYRMRAGRFSDARQLIVLK